MSVFHGRQQRGALREHRERKRAAAEVRNTAYRKRIRASRTTVRSPEAGEPWRKYHKRTNANSFDASCKPCGKRIYNSRDRARQAIKSLGGQGMRPYRCREPAGGWHIGHYLPKQLRGPSEHT